MTEEYYWTSTQEASGHASIVVKDKKDPIHTEDWVMSIGYSLDPLYSPNIHIRKKARRGDKTDGKEKIYSLFLSDREFEKLVRMVEQAKATIDPSYKNWPPRLTKS